MAAEIGNELETALQEFSEVLAEVGEPGFASAMSRLRSALQNAETPEERRPILSQGLAFFGGMNSLNDVVIMQGSKPDIEANRRVDRLRTRVYDLLVEQL